MARKHASSTENWRETQINSVRTILDCNCDRWRWGSNWFPFVFSPYSARFITDENTPDGTRMQPGQVFRKVWVLLNDGSMPWNGEDIQLVNLTDGIQVIRQPDIPVIAPHDRAFISVDFVSADQPGTYESKWILSYRHHTFGPMIWCSIEVVQSTATSKLSSKCLEKGNF